MTLSFSFDFAEEKTKPFVLCKSWLKGKFPACVMTIRLIAVSCCESSEKECPSMILLLVKISIEHGFQISVAHSFVCSRLKSRRFFSQCAVHSSFCPQSFFLAKINNFIWFVDPYANARVPLIPICSDFSCFYRTTMAAWEEDIVSSLLWFTGSCSIYCMWAYFHLV